MSMEPKLQEEDNADDQSESKMSNNKTRRIKKSPKPNKRNPDPPNLNKKESVLSELRLIPQFGLFQSQMQKQSRLQKFWMVEIDSYYRNQLGEEERQMLNSIIEQDVPSLRQVLQNEQQIIQPLKQPFQELFRYVQLVKESRTGGQLMLVENQDKRFLAVFAENGDLDRIIQIAQEQAFLLAQRQKFMHQLKRRQQEYNNIHSTNQHLSELSSEVAFLLYLMRQSKQRVSLTLQLVQQRIRNEPKADLNRAEVVKDRYVACLIRKNLRLALLNPEIDTLNYFANLDAIQQYGAEPQTKPITDKKEFQEYMRKKKSKKSRKNPKNVLKTACGGCLSAHFQQYNPFLYCPDCHVRYHKYCYTPIRDSLCESCLYRKDPSAKARAIQCQLCPNRGLLSTTYKSGKQVVSVHVFCMLINGLWKFENGSLQFQSSHFMNSTAHDDLCTICNSAVYTYTCSKCSNRAHPLCAYLSGWNIEISQQGGVILQCCKGVKLQKNSYRRKFILNYKKILFKSEKER